MSLKIETNTSAVAYHVVDGTRVFPYAIDARHAVSHFPQEWSHTPWSADEAAAGRQFIRDRHARETEEAHDRAEAKRLGLPAPLAFKDEVELTPEDQAAIDEHTKAVAEANERLATRRKKIEEERLEAEQVAADEALVRSAPPMPDPNKPLTAKQRRQRAAETDEERVIREENERIEADKLRADKTGTL